MRLRYPLARRRRVSAEPTMPRWPATNMRMSWRVKLLTEVEDTAAIPSYQFVAPCSLEILAGKVDDAADVERGCSAPDVVHVVALSRHSVLRSAIGPL